LERLPLAQRIGWEVLINPDEEIGSPGSAHLFAAAAVRNDLGLVFEPAFPDGNLVSSRKGSGNFSAVVRGRAAHAGRDFHLGRNAIEAAARFAVSAAELNGSIPGVTVNVARIDGGGPANVVPDLAICRLNARVETFEQQTLVHDALRRIAADIDRRDGISIELHGEFLSPPKVLDEPTLALLGHVAECARELGMPAISWRPSGGASDANKLAAAGLTVVDTLGPRGGNMHSAEEYLLVESLTERAALSALLLLKLAGGQIDWPAKRRAPMK
jgi:glutamate carboxypeptidase